MISFESDYITGAHPEVLKKLIESNAEVLTGYGFDAYCDSAREKIRAACECPEADVYFLVGGTQTNATVISTMLAPYEGVVAAETGHVSVHEAGAIEATGHKVLTIPQKDGKICAADLRKYLETFYGDSNHEHMVFPGMTYISHPTEYGTLYTKQELTELHEICQEYHMPLYMDGARMACAIMSYQTDVTLADIARLTDVFYIGGTKCGALCGEAVVFTKGNTPKYFMSQVKQHGALMAKGRLLGIQFDALFTDDLYYRIGRHEIDMAEKLKKVFREKKCNIYLESPTNQQFIILENEQARELSQQVAISFWEAYDEHHTIYRFATAWSTTEEEILQLKELL